MAFSPEDQARLTAYKTAYDAILEGRSLQEVRDENGKLLRFHPGNAKLLQAEIDKLEARKATQSNRSRGAVSFTVR